MPDNPVAKAGNTTRLNHMLTYFSHCQNLNIEFLSLEDWGKWNLEDVKFFKENYPKIKLHLFQKKYKKNFFKYFFLYKIPYLFKNNSIDISSFILRKKTKALIRKNNYDFIVISYASWARIIDNCGETAFKIIDTHDFLTAQGRDDTKKIGKMFQDEIEILKKFDQIWTYSVEEEYLFEQFSGKKVILLPVSFPMKKTEVKYDYKYNIIFVGSDNKHNITGIKWFINKVLPLLKDVKIHIIGKICNHIADYPNIIKHGIVDQLDDFYNNAKIAICPMHSGTGIKIKVIEALSYTLPVVTNRRGVDGLINKKENGCLVSEDEKQFAENILKLLYDDDFYKKTKTEAENYFSTNHLLQIEKEKLDHIFGQ